MHLLLILALLAQSDVKPDSSKGKGGKAGLFKTETIDVGGTEREYRLLVPRSLKLQKANPLVFAFHGLGGNKDRLANYCGLDSTAKKEGFVLVYPSAVNGRWTMFSSQKSQDLEFFDKLYAHLCDRYRIDRNRVYATGMSMGGYFCNLLGSQRSDKIAAIAPHSGGLGVLARTGVRAKRKYAVMVIHGDADKVVSVSEGRKSRDAYEKAGHPLLYREIEGLGHRWATAQKINTEIWKFFSEHPLRKAQ